MQFPPIGSPLITRRTSYMVRCSPDDDITLVEGYRHRFHQPAVDFHDRSDPEMHVLYNHGQSTMHCILDARALLTRLGRININRHIPVLPDTR